jgi:molybdate transport system substrate-binding protein
MTPFYSRSLTTVRSSGKTPCSIPGRAKLENVIVHNVMLTITLSFENDIAHKPSRPTALSFTAAALLIVLIAFASSGQSQKPQVTIAAAANLTDVFQQLGPAFEKATGVHPVFSFASTAVLTQQIENSAPFDVFAAADSAHIDELAQKGFLLSGSRAIYARGILALWIPPGSKAHINRIEDLVQPEVRFIAVAKPELAPYGQAAVDALTRAGIWKQVQPKIVYAENINVAKQYGSSNNADAVLTAYSLVLREAGKVIRIDEALHKPIDQALGIIGASKHLGEARKFTDFLLGAEGRNVLSSNGYQINAAP